MRQNELIKPKCRIIGQLLTACFNFLKLDVHNIFRRYNVLSEQSLKAIVNVLPAPDVINDHQQLTDEAGEGGWDHDDGPHSEHLTLQELLWTREVQSLFCEDESKH